MLIINFLDSIGNTIQGTVDTTQKTAHSLVDTGKTYASSAKGKFLFHFLFFILSLLLNMSICNRYGSRYR